MTVHVCRTPVWWQRRIRHCPTCDRRRRFVGMRAVWYPTIWSCCACGDAWDGDSGEMMPRPFSRAWRDHARRVAREHWQIGSRDMPDWFRAELEAAVSG